MQIAVAHLVSFEGPARRDIVNSSPPFVAFGLRAPTKAIADTGGFGVNHV